MEPTRRVEHRYRVRFDEADANGRLRPSGLLRYAQDMAWRHSEEAGFDRAWYRERDLTWLVRNVQVSIEGPITYGDVLAVSTEVIGWRQVWARRHSDVVLVGPGTDPDAGLGPGSAQPQRMAVVRTDWVLLGSDGRPARVPTEIAASFSPGRPFTRDRVALPDPTGTVATLATRVRPLDVDPMRHMNNAAYLDMVDDGRARLPRGQRLPAPDRYRLGYVAPALPGMRIAVSCWAVDATRVACRISDGAGSELARALVSRSGG